MNKPQNRLFYTKAVDLNEMSVAGILEAKESLRELVSQDFETLPAEFNDDNIEVCNYYDQDSELIVRFYYTNPNFKEEQQAYDDWLCNNAKFAEHYRTKKLVAASYDYRKQYKEERRRQRVSNRSCGDKKDNAVTNKNNWRCWS